ncbi:MAG: tetraacyldisaccharide 4'-kinase [Cyanobacteria bacterium HKST-UBA06]|nr:tetraacyldisaccharide 4'-kinase [Cyanobacteria bacterium HKST-UBA06]
MAKLLLPLTWTYRLGVALRYAAYRLGWLKPVTVDVPVISIGNLTTGGTGKTPIVIALAHYLEEQGYKLVILSRGYAARQPQVYAQATDPRYGDEAFLIQQHLTTGTVIVGKNRKKTIEWAVKDYQPDIVIVDDGFQNIGLTKTLDVLLIDGSKGLGNGHLLPVGPLREPLAAVDRATHVILTKNIHLDVANKVNALLDRYAQKDKPVWECPFQASHLFHPFSGRLLSFVEMDDTPYAILSGIAHPDTLEGESQKRLKGDMVTHLRFTDHHQYVKGDIEDIMLLLKNYHRCVVITTSKDWVKIKSLIIPEFLNRFFIFEMKPMFDWQRLLDDLMVARSAQLADHQAAAAVSDEVQEPVGAALAKDGDESA